MATEDVSSTRVSNPFAVPPTQVPAGANGGALRYTAATVEATAKDAGSIYRMVLVPWSAFIHQVWLATDDLGTTATLNVGAYYSPGDGDAVVDADCFASAVDCNAAAVAWTDVTSESGVFTIDEVVKRLWEIAGLSADPGGHAVIACTSVGAIDAAGTISLKVIYAVD